MFIIHILPLHHPGKSRSPDRLVSLAFAHRRNPCIAWTQVTSTVNLLNHNPLRIICPHVALEGQRSGSLRFIHC